MEPETGIYVTSMYAAISRRPLVGIRIGDHAPVNIPPEDARAVAANLLAAAEAAESDAFLFEFMSKDAGIDEQHAALLLRQFRVWRDAQRATQP